MISHRHRQVGAHGRGARRVLRAAGRPAEGAAAAVRAGCRRRRVQRLLRRQGRGLVQLRARPRRQAGSHRRLLQAQGPGREARAGDVGRAEADEPRVDEFRSQADGRRRRPRDDPAPEEPRGPLVPRARGEGGRPAVRRAGALRPLQQGRGAVGGVPRARRADARRARRARVDHRHGHGQDAAAAEARLRHAAPAGRRGPHRADRVPYCAEINQCVGCTRQFFTSFLGDDAADLAQSSGEEPASPRHRAGVASMAWRTTR